MSCRLTYSLSTPERVGFRALGSAFRVWDLGFGVWDFGFRDGGHGLAAFLLQCEWGPDINVLRFWIKVPLIQKLQMVRGLRLLPFLEGEIRWSGRKFGQVGGIKIMPPRSPFFSKMSF